MNDVQVEHFTDSEAGMLAKHKDGHKFPVKSNGKIELRMRLTTNETKFVMVSSFVIW